MKLLPIAVALSLMGGAAQAQFVGDVFAQVPSVAAPAGGQVTIEMQLFSGANVFGASIVGLTYQEVELSVREVTLTGVNGNRRVAVTHSGVGRVDIATISVDATANPIGTVTLAQVTFDVRAPVGRVVRYRMTPQRIIAQDESNYAVISGAEGEIAVVTALAAPATSAARLDLAATAATTTPASAAKIMVTADGAVMARATALRPRGGAVDLVMLVNQGGQVVSQVVRVQPATAGNTE